MLFEVERTRGRMRGCLADREQHCAGLELDYRVMTLIPKSVSGLEVLGTFYDGSGLIFLAPTSSGTGHGVVRDVVATNAVSFLAKCAEKQFYAFYHSCLRSYRYFLSIFSPSLMVLAHMAYSTLLFHTHCCAAQSFLDQRPSLPYTEASGVLHV